MSHYNQKALDRFLKSEEASKWFSHMNERGILCVNVPAPLQKMFQEAVNEAIKEEAWRPKEKKYDLRLIDRTNPMINSGEIIEFMNNKSLNHIQFFHYQTTIMNFFTTKYFWYEANKMVNWVLKKLNLNSENLSPDCLNYVYETVYAYDVLTSKLMRENNYHPSQISHLNQ